MINWLWRLPLILFVIVFLDYQNEHILRLKKQLADNEATVEDLRKYEFDCIDEIAKLSAKYRHK
jgi:hypothetical protein